MERRGRIPVAKFRTQEGKTRSRSRVREPDYNEQDPETDLFTLLEDNIALKEENKSLKLKIEDEKRKHDELLDSKSQIYDELETLKKQQIELVIDVKDINSKYNKIVSERNALDRMHKMKMERINDLTQELQQLEIKQKQESAQNAVVDSIDLKSKLLKILPTLSANNDMESIIDIDSTAPLPITNELLDRLVDEFLSLKNSMNAVELQLYEANEKIAELIENQHHLEEENETIRSENTNLTKVAKLLTENMKESVETSKKMETALIKLKQRNDELTAKSRDLIDGLPEATPSPTTIKTNEEFEQIKEEVQAQNRDHNERIVEMKSLMEAAIQKNTNDELKTLQLKLEIMEEELRNAIARADMAEKELENFKSHNLNKQITHHNLQQQSSVTTIAPAPLPPPPPPPPPMPAHLLYKPATSLGSHNAFSDNIASHNFHKGSVGASGGGSGDNSSKVIDTVKQQVQAEAATGLDALVREFKSGRVTLRRNRRKTRTNDALQEMFQVLEISQTQNRNSKICINMNTNI